MRTYLAFFDPVIPEESYPLTIQLSGPINTHVLLLLFLLLLLLFKFLFLMVGVEEKKEKK